MTSSGQTDRTELLLRIRRQALVALLVLILLIAATLIAHVVSPGSLLADWASRIPLLPVAIGAVIFMFTHRWATRFRANDPDVEAVVNDEFRRANVAWAQRVALIVVLVAQVPLALFLSELSAVAAVTVMSVATITIALVTFIIAFLFADRG